ncbi:unnamed protein product [Tilletia controversa]|nr:unnamed protein product [Tilletia controversa]
MRDCEALKQYLDSGILVKDFRGYYWMAGGSPVPPYSVEVRLVKALRDLGHVPREQVPSTTNSIIYPQPAELGTAETVQSTIVTLGPRRTHPLASPPL